MGVDLVRPAEIPERCHYQYADVAYLNLAGIRCWESIFGPFDFICASPPCEQFSVHGMKHFHPNPVYPDLGIKLFEATRSLCEWMALPYIIENVRAAQQFVGNAQHHCGAYYLWGNGVPTLIPRGIQKGISMGGDKFKDLPIEQRRELRKQYRFLQGSSHGAQRKEVTADAATIPPELSACVAEYAERLVEMKGKQNVASVQAVQKADDGLHVSHLSPMLTRAEEDSLSAQADYFEGVIRGDA